MKELIFILLSHPILILYSFKDGRHKLLEILIVGFLFIILSIYEAHEVIDHLHYQVVVVSTITILEYESAVGKVVVGK